MNKQDKLINKQPAPPLSVVVSCKGLDKILPLHLTALKKQDLNHNLWQAVFIFQTDTSENASSSSLKTVISLIKQYFPLSQILFLKKEQSLYEMRNLAFDRLDSSYLYFIDEDVILEDSHHLSRLMEHHQKYSELTVLGGAYLSDPRSTFWGDCYNWLVRLWVKAHRTANYQDMAPAGNLSVKNHKKFQARFYSPSGFGAEEIYFLRDLHKEGLMSYADSALDAPHLAQHSFKNFVQRAWIHGRNRPQKKLGAKILFFKEPAGFLVKITGLFYLLLVRFSSIWRQLEILVSKIS